jgi:hypothetical protein
MTRTPFLLVLAITTARGVAAERLTITQVAIVDPSTPVRPNMDVVIDGHSIVEIRKHRDGVAGGERQIDGKGKFLIPGLWDMHVHAASNASRFFPLLIASGVTGVRNMHSTAKDPLALCLEIKKDVDDGKRIGPRFFTNGPIVDGPNAVWPGSVVVRNAEEARTAVDRLHAAGADFIKVYDFVPRDAYFAIAEETKRLDMPFAGHLPFSVTLQDAIAAGQKSIEHTDRLVASSSTDRARVDAAARALLATEPKAAMPLRLAYARAVSETFDPEKSRSVAAQLASSQTWVCPTLVALQTAEEVLQDRQGWSVLGQHLVEEWTEEAEEMKPFDPVEARMERAGSIVVREMSRAHVRMLAGTDIGNPGLVPGASLHLELKLMVRAGMSPKEALFAATLGPLQFLGIEGGIEENRRADLVLLAGNPLEDIANIDRIVAVWLNGMYFDRAALDEMLKPKP